MGEDLSPLICFYQNEDFIFSENYERKECPENETTVEFLKDIEKNYFHFLKIVQINFESATNQISLYPSAKATVFILQNFEIKNLSVILQKYPIVKDQIVFQSLMDKNEFHNKTIYILDQIKKGRIYQANLTAPLKAKTQLNGFEIFSHYQQAFQGKYKAFLPLKEVDVSCFSPELFLQQMNGRLITRPIKGSSSQTKDFDDSLIRNEKENAELTMIVDLLRNDLNSLSAEESSVVKAHREPMSLGYIQHTFSEIEVKSHFPLSHVIDKTFPGGSISGCPKVESLKVIHEVEKHRRQIYTGSLGWWKENEFCLNIVIRTLIQHQSDLYYHAGCGIVFDSDPKTEWDEYLLKTGSLSVQH